MAGRTADGVLAFRGSSSFTCTTGILAGNFNFGFQAKGSFSKGNLQIIAKIGTPFRTSSPAPPKNIAEAEELAQYVAEISKGARVKSAESALQPAVAVAVIAGALFGIAQNTVSLGGFFELLLGAFVIRILVRVVFECKLSVSTLYFLVRRILGNSKDFVVISFVVQ